MGKTASTKKSGVPKVLLDGYDQDNPLALSAEEARRLYEQGIVYKIIRSKSDGS